MVDWLIVNYSQSETDKVIRGVESSGSPYRVISPSDVYTKHFDDSNSTIVYGTIGSVNYLSRECGFQSWCDLPNLKCSKYFPHYYEYLFNRNGVFLPLELVIRGYRDYNNSYTLFGYEGGEECIFIRPDSNDKSFTGYIATVDDLEKLKAVVGGEVMCYISPPNKDVYEAINYREYRFCISNNKVVTGSRYLPEESIDIPNYVMDKAKEIAKIKYDGQPEIFVIDLIEDELTEDVFLLELGAINTAGWYLMDPIEIVEVCNEKVRISKSF